MPQEYVYSITAKFVYSLITVTSLSYISFKHSNSLLLCITDTCKGFQESLKCMFFVVSRQITTLLETILINFMENFFNPPDNLRSIWALLNTVHVGQVKIQLLCMFYLLITLPEQYELREQRFIERPWTQLHRWNIRYDIFHLPFLIFFISCVKIFLSHSAKRKHCDTLYFSLISVLTGNEPPSPDRFWSQPRLLHNG